MQIKNRFTNDVIFENDAETMRQTAMDAVESGAYLSGADLSGANLSRANLSVSTGVFSFGPIGKTGRIGYAVDGADGVMFALGCFWGNEKEAISAIRAKYGEKSLYETQIKLAAKIVKAARNG